MKLSEKTLELNICAQVSQHVGSKRHLLWFGLTQKQEAQAGFDACTKFGGRLLIFQFKASNRVIRSGERVFLAPHAQLVALRKCVNSHRRSVFYAFPLLGTTTELTNNPNIVSQTWLLDVADLQFIQAPTTSKGNLRKNGCHNIYVKPGHATIHSDPVEANIFQLSEVVSSNFPEVDDTNWAFNQHFDQFWKFSQLFSKNARGVVLW